MAAEVSDQEPDPDGGELSERNDSTNATNKFLNSEDEHLQGIGFLIAVIGIVLMVALEIVVLVRFKKNTEKYCAMSLIPEHGEAADGDSNS